MMTETDFFLTLERLTIEQLTMLHNELLLLIKCKKEKQHQAALEQEALKHKANQPQSLPKLRTNSNSIDDMANELDLDLSSIMREISKR